MVANRSTEIDRFHARFDADLVATSHSRVAFEGWLRDAGAREDTVEELMIVFSELVANAVEASPGTRQQIHTSAWTEDGKVVLRVVNPVMPSTTSVTEPDLGDPLRTGGRGLLIVRAYTDAMRTEVADDTIVVRCERRITA